MTPGHSQPLRASPDSGPRRRVPFVATMAGRRKRGGAEPHGGGPAGSAGSAGDDAATERRVGGRAARVHPQEGAPLRPGASSELVTDCESTVNQLPINPLEPQNFQGLVRREPWMAGHSAAQLLTPPCDGVAAVAFVEAVIVARPPPLHASTSEAPQPVRIFALVPPTHRDCGVLRGRVRRDEN